MIEGPGKWKGSQRWRWMRLVAWEKKVEGGRNTRCSNWRTNGMMPKGRHASRPSVRRY